LCAISQAVRLGNAVRLPNQPRFLIAKSPGGSQTQALAQLGVIAPLGMSIQRQVVGEEIDVVCNSKRQALAHPARHPPIMAAPKQAMVYHDGVGPVCDGGLDQGQTGRHTRYDSAHRISAPLHLQAVGAIVLELRGLEQGIQRAKKFLSVSHGVKRGRRWRASRV
jgi:hypothetical protein